MQKPIALFGYGGFVGSWLLNGFQSEFTHLYNSTNYQTAADMEFDTVFFVGLPAAKWYVNTHPDEDLTNIERIISTLRTIKSNCFVLISTIDAIDAVDVYGQHRKKFEEFIIAQFAPNYLIFRLPALFGRGLKKNVLYDLLHNNQLDKINPMSSFQWYDLQWLQEDIKLALSKNLRCVNRVSQPLSTNVIIKLLFPEHSGQIIKEGNEMTIQFAESVQYNVRTLGLDLIPVNSVIAVMRSFVKEEKERTVKRRNYSLGVSAIGAKDNTTCWQEKYIATLKFNDIDYCELAPTLICDWNDLTPEILQSLPVYSFQSITFNIPFNLFTEPDKLLEHLQRVVNLAAATNTVRCIIFGCPKTRRIPDGFKDPLTVAASFFRSLVCPPSIHVCIENNSAQYGCNFLTQPTEVADFVRLVNHPQIRMMLDIGNAVMEENGIDNICDFIERNSDILQHVHVSEPHMCPLFDESLHRAVATTLKRINYSYGVTMEMISHPSFAQSVALFAEWY